MASNKRKIQILENRVIRPAVIDSDSDSSEEIFSTKKTKKDLETNRKTKHKRSPSGRKFHILKSVSFSHETKTECKNKPTPQTSKGLSSPSSSSLERFSMYSSRGCSPSLNNISASKLMHGIEIDESEYHDLINLRNDNKKIKKKNEIERKDPKTKLTFTYSFEDSMSQGLTESNENYGFYDEERNKQFEENERQKETLNDEAEREKETENVDVEDVEEREEETGNAEEEDEDAEREEETENTEEEDEEQESGDTGDDESDAYSASEVVSDIDNDVSEEEEDAQDNSVNEWDAVTDLTPELDACTLNESTFNIPIEDISPAAIHNTNKLKKIHDLANMLNSRFQEVLTPGKFIVIDESMIPWRGRLKFKQYIKNKSHKYGVKIYKLCTPEGYIYNSIIYSGKGENGREQNHGKVTVLKLIQGLENKCRVVIADNFYSSIELAEELLSQKTRYCGTLNSKRRGLPKEIVLLKLKKGEIKGAMNKNGVKVIKWVDKRQLLMISTLKEDKDVLVNTGKKIRKTNEDIKKPTCVLTYNNNKKGVDFSDQMSSYCSTLKRGLKWFRKVGMEYLLGMALLLKAIPTFPCFNIVRRSTSAIENQVKPKDNDHVLEMSAKRRNCAGCYDRLRKTFNSTEAKKK
ncbi:unnamed protein product [Arctia plantaginis]|uniref:PiggyBac transposable element-derived protein domain-containing protein n=1 Tax=Arctia plantaginis TaxID=874455 RepID=A0A8S0YRJ1_ARCPL|nr:unnamed protein product [Arctia plantaginis]